MLLTAGSRRATTRSDWPEVLEHAGGWQDGHLRPEFRPGAIHSPSSFTEFPMLYRSDLSKGKAPIAAGVYDYKFLVEGSTDWEERFKRSQKNSWAGYSAQRKPSEVSYSNSQNEGTPKVTKKLRLLWPP